MSSFTSCSTSDCRMKMLIEDTLEWLTTVSKKLIPSTMSFQLVSFSLLTCASKYGNGSSILLTSICTGICILPWMLCEITRIGVDGDQNRKLKIYIIRFP